MDRGEDEMVDVVQDPERLRDVVGAGVELPEVIEDGRHPHEPDMVRKGLGPCIQVGWKRLQWGQPYQNTSTTSTRSGSEVGWGAGSFW